MRKNTIRRSDGCAKSRSSGGVDRFRSKMLSLHCETHDFSYEGTTLSSIQWIWMWPTMKQYRITISKSLSKIWMRMKRGSLRRSRNHLIERRFWSTQRHWTPTKWNTNARNYGADTFSGGYFDECERYRSDGENQVAKSVAEVNTLVFDDWLRF